MTYKAPAQVARAAVVSGTSKAAMRPDKVLIGAFLAGAYIAFGGLVAISVSSGLDPKRWGTLPTLITGAAFSLGLILVVIAGSELLTGNMALVPIAALQRKVTIMGVSVNLFLVLIGNLVGSLFVAYFLAVKTGVIGTHATGGLTYERLAAIAKAKAVTESDYQIFLRAVGCNWLVCLAVWLALAADDIAGKILGIFFPIMAFVAMGFDHVVANMFFLPAAMFAHVPGITFEKTMNNLFFALIGNLLGAVLFVATSYWYLHLRNEPDPDLIANPQPSPGSGAQPVGTDRLSGA